MGVLLENVVDLRAMAWAFSYLLAARPMRLGSCVLADLTNLHFFGVSLFVGHCTSHGSKYWKHTNTK